MKSAMTGATARVARILLDSGPMTASELCKQLDLTGTGVRRHLDSLVGEGFADATERAPFGPTKPRGRGRPARVYTLTAVGRDAFDQAYDDLAIAALRYIADSSGSAGLDAFARNRAADMERRYLVAVHSQASTEQRAEVLAGLLHNDGYAAGIEPAGASGIQICQHHCPIAHVAEEFPQLCDAETAAFGRLIGTHVTRLATLSHGDGVCTTHIHTVPAGTTGESSLRRSEPLARVLTPSRTERTTA